jgi:hypothetical protein
MDLEKKTGKTDRWDEYKLVYEVCLIVTFLIIILLVLFL